MRIRSVRNQTHENEAPPEWASASPAPSVTCSLTEAEAARYIGMSPGWLKSLEHAGFGVS